LSADGRASASKVVKKAEKVQISQYFEDFSKVEDQKLNVCACLKRFMKPYAKKITLDTLWREICCIKNVRF
jgi:hypothetical protein